MRNIVCSVAGVLLFVMLFPACGDEGEPGPGYTDPCDTPMGPVLACPVGQSVTRSTFTLFDACQKLVTCGIVASEWFGAHVHDSPCRSSDECKEGQECLPYGESGRECYDHRLDYRWCTARLAGSRSNPCDGDRSFTDQEVAAILRCIETTPCSALGLPFATKSDSDNPREPDKYTCKDGKTIIHTSTICDYGLLRY